MSQEQVQKAREWLYTLRDHDHAMALIGEIDRLQAELSAKTGELERAQDELTKEREANTEWKRQYDKLLERKRRIEKYVPDDQRVVLDVEGNEPNG